MENKRIPITVSPNLISRADFRDKALKAYLKNRRQRNLEKSNRRRGSNLLSESSDEECEPDEIFLEKAWKEYQSFFKNQLEEDFDIDHCIEQYFSDIAIQSLTVTNFTDEYCFLQEEELNDLLDKMDGIDLSATSVASLGCPVCSSSILDYKDEYYACSSCKIKAKNQVKIHLYFFILSLIFRLFQIIVQRRLLIGKFFNAIP
ncbi:hypothetical protein DSO57_1010735 [Entomophthora muscae]|uniref:Uncharacterized protein n=1 Tax=Entomophthora muscae TaxID=34485 RepID=A0ACC2SVA9_9FUNG|nr:hypothetical protein DSO57_1010735 [Entomophthora muscae]